MQESIKYVLADTEKKSVENLRELLDRMPKEPGFDPALEFKLELLQLLLPFASDSERFSRFLANMRDLLLQEN